MTFYLDGHGVTERRGVRLVPRSAHVRVLRVALRAVRHGVGGDVEGERAGGAGAVPGPGGDPLGGGRGLRPERRHHGRPPRARAPPQARWARCSSAAADSTAGPAARAGSPTPSRSSDRECHGDPGGGATASIVRPGTGRAADGAGPTAASPAGGARRDRRRRVRAARAAGPPACRPPEPTAAWRSPGPAAPLPGRPSAPGAARRASAPRPADGCRAAPWPPACAAPRR